MAFRVRHTGIYLQIASDRMLKTTLTLLYKEEVTELGTWHTQLQAKRARRRIRHTTRADLTADAATKLSISAFTGQGAGINVISPEIPVIELVCHGDVLGLVGVHAPDMRGLAVVEDTLRENRGYKREAKELTGSWQMWPEGRSAQRVP